MSIINLDKLAELNNTMLGRGAPNVKDDTGYNKPDYCLCRNIFYGMSNIQASDLCVTLQKYAKTQLNIDKADLIESAEYYKKLSENMKPSISIKYDNEYTSFYFEFDYDIISIIKSAKDRRFNGNNKCWLVNNKEVITILDKLSKIANTENAKKYFLTMFDGKEEVETKEEINKIEVTDNEKYIEVKFKYNASIVAAVKSCNDRKYNSANYSWKVNKFELAELIERLKKIDNIDYSEIEKYIIKEDKVVITELKEMVNATRKPFNHQLEAANFLLTKKKAILADEMGGGKTLSSIIAAYNIEGKKLIISPASLKLNWSKEIKMIDSEAKIFIISGKSKIELDDSEWVIINYDIVQDHLDTLKKAEFKCVIMDEAHYIKSVNNSGKPTTNRGKSCVAIANNSEYVFLLTGTPITNKTKDIFNALSIVNHPVATKFMSFALRYCRAYKGQFGWDTNGSSNRHELNDKLKPYMMRRLKEELLDLPDKIRSFIPVEIDIIKYKRKLAEYMNKRKDITAGEQLVELNALRQLAAIEKIQYTIEQIDNILDQDKQVIVFTCYNEVVNQIISKYKNAAKITGDVSGAKRQDTVDKFQSGKIKVLVCNIVAAGVGLTLTAADTVIFNDFDWTPANHLQAEDRIHRIGQNKKCNIYYMYASNAVIDNDMSELIEKKLDNINTIVDKKDNSIFVELTNNLK